MNYSQEKKEDTLMVSLMGLEGNGIQMVGLKKKEITNKVKKMVDGLII